MIASPKAHSQLPWHQGPHYRADIMSPEGLVAEARPFNSPRGEANSAFIVHAVNCHEELLAALKAVTEHMDRAGGDGYGMPECPWCKAQGRLDGDDNYHLSTCELIQARAAIAKAEGREVIA